MTDKNLPRTTENHPALSLKGQGKHQRAGLPAVRQVMKNLG